MRVSRECATDRRLATLVAFAAALSILSFLLVEIHDYDIWWHAIIGRMILASHAVPRTDLFTVAGYGRPYHDSHWFFQVLSATADRIGGVTALSLLSAVLWGLTLTVSYLAARRWASVPAAAILAFLAAMASSERFLPRPEVVTCLMIGFFCLRLQEGRIRTATDLLVLLAAQVVWTNSHGLFVFGPFLVGCYLLCAAVRREPTRRLFVLFVLVLAATLANPYGWEGWRYARLLFTEVGPSASAAMREVGELSPTLGAAVRSNPAFRFFALLTLGAITAAFHGIRRRQVSPARLLIACGVFAAALTGRRNMALFAVVAPALCGEGFSGGIPWLSRGMRRILLVLAAVFMIGWSWFPLSGEYYRRMEIFARFGFGASPSFFPHNLLSYLNRIRFRGNVYSSNRLGGYYLYRSWPERLPLDDGRWEIYDAAVISFLDEVRRDPALIEELAKRYEIRGLLLEHDEATTFVPSLRSAGRWRLVSYDCAASFWARADDPRFPLSADPTSGAPLPPAPRVEDTVLLDRFLAVAGTPELRLRNLERAGAFGALLGEAGALQASLGRYEDAERSFRALLRKAPQDDEALNSLSFLALKRGDLEEAKRLLRRAMRLRPENELYLRNYRRLEAGGNP